MPTAVTVPPRVRRTAVDVALAALLCGLELLVSWETTAAPGPAVPLYALLGCSVLLWRRHFPVAVYVIVVVHSVLAAAVVSQFVPTLGVWLALYTVAVRCERRVAVLGLLVAFGPTLLDAVVEGYEVAGRRVIVAAVMGTVLNLVVFGLGRWAAWSVRQRRLVAELAAAEAVAVERGRIARDLHDIVAHSVTLMVLQAAGAARTLRGDPERAEEALRQVDGLGQQAIDELRRMLGLLDPDPDPTGVAAPPAGLGDVRSLVDAVRGGGVPVELALAGAPVPLEPAVDLSGYRILQEALTNTVKHADPRHPVRVELRWQGTEVEIRVDNRSARSRPRAPHPLSTGHGIRGMRERAHAVGGRLDAGPRSDGSFRVTATLPVPPSPRSGRR